MEAPFEWTPRSWRAAAAVADGRLTDQEIAADAGVSVTRIRAWRQNDVFKVEVQRLRDEIATRVFNEGIALRSERLRALNERWLNLQRIIRERAARYTAADAEDEIRLEGGIGTGLILPDMKAVGITAHRFFKLDTGLLNELRSIEKQAAIELGQWTEKSEIAGNDEKPLVVKVLRGVSMDDL